jgi:hypothetical protein
VAVAPLGRDVAATDPSNPPPLPDEAAGPVDAGPSATDLLARAKTAADNAGSTADWNRVLELLADAVLASDEQAAELRATATRERDARQAFDEAQSALVGGDFASAAAKLAAIPPDARCATDAAGAWSLVIDAGREAAQTQKVEDLRRVVDALRGVVAPPPRVARGRDELVALLRRLDTAAPPAVDAGTTPVREAGTAPADARVRTDAGTAPVRDTAVGPAEAAAPTTNAAEEAYTQARQMILDGNNDGCIATLTRAPQVCRNIEVLVTCYKAASRMSDAYGAMENYVRRCSGQRKFDEYSQILQAAGRSP